MIRSSHDKMRFYFGKDNNTFLDLGPEDTIDIVPTGKVLTGVQWDGGRARWQATYWDGKRMACKSFPIQTYGGDSEKAKAAAQEFQAAQRNVSPDLTLPVRAADISESVMTHFRYVPRGITYPPQPVPLHPYFLGCWLGDGHSASPSITNIDEEILAWLRGYASTMGWTVNERLITQPNGRSHTLVSFPKEKGKAEKGAMFLLRSLGLVLPYRNYRKRCHIEGAPDVAVEEAGREGTDDDGVDVSTTPAALMCKHIPKCYLHNSTEVRLQLLAGLIDTDGHLAGTSGTACWEISQKSKRLIADIKILADGLGFFTYLTVSEKYASNTVKKTKRPYGRLIIYTTRFTPNVPVLLPRKQWAPCSSRNNYYPLIRTARTNAPVRQMWTPEMDAHLLRIKPSYSRGSGTNWKRMVEKESIFAGMGTGQIRGRHRDLTKRTAKSMRKVRQK